MHYSKSLRVPNFHPTANTPVCITHGTRTARAFKFHYRPGLSVKVINATCHQCMPTGTRVRVTRWVCHRQHCACAEPCIGEYYYCSNCTGGPGRRNFLRTNSTFRFPFSFPFPFPFSFPLVSAKSTYPAICDAFTVVVASLLGYQPHMRMRACVL